jgi:hypothetical protein
MHGSENVNKKISINICMRGMTLQIWDSHEYEYEASALWDVTPFNALVLSCSEYHDLPKRPVFTTSHFRTTLKMETAYFSEQLVGLPPLKLHGDKPQQLMILKLSL